MAYENRYRRATEELNTRKTDKGDAMRRLDDLKARYPDNANLDAATKAQLDSLNKAVKAADNSLKFAENTERIYKKKIEERDAIQREAAKRKGRR